MAAHWKDAGIADGEVLDKLLEGGSGDGVRERRSCRGAVEAAGGEYAERRA
jgi:hypothetical protein